jgi:hypothetical protein
MRSVDLQKVLTDADPAAVLVPPRTLERIVTQAYRLRGMFWNVPHAHCHVTDRHILFSHLEQADLDLQPDQVPPDIVIALARPGGEELANAEPGQLLLDSWRLLFHASIHRHFGSRTAPTAPDNNGKPAAIPLTAAPLLSDDDVRERVEAIGRTEFDEIRRVLVAERFLPANADDRTTYVEFASVYLELRYFAAGLLPNFFPGLRDLARIEMLLQRDVDAAELFRRTRLKGAPDPVVPADTRTDESHEYYFKLVRQADRACRAGNLVRAAILRTTASRVAPAALTAQTRADGEEDMRQLARRLQAALQWTDTETDEWAGDLIKLLDKADQGRAPVEARLLHDLQNVCIDSERDIYALGLAEWVKSLGRRPVKRPLPSQRYVRIARHLRSAAGRLSAVRLADADRQHLGRLLHAALGRSEEALRARFGPILTTALHDVGLTPANPPERAAFNKMVEEMLDRITAQGFLSFSDLRDAISRNQLKMPDLPDPRAFIRGDPLLRLDRRLGQLLDGVYRPGELYMRLLERTTALNFGTTAGRAFTKWVTIPFGGAALTLVGVQVLSEYVPGPSLDHALKGSALFFWLYWLLGSLAVGLFYLALLHSGAFRRRLHGGFVAAGRGLKHAFWDLPRDRLPWERLRLLAASWPFELFYWYVFRPAVLAALVWLLWHNPPHNPYFFLGLWAACALVLNLPFGQALTEAVWQAFVGFWELLRSGLIVGLYHFIVQVFKQAVDWLDNMLFTVDEWLRFRGGDSGLSMAVRLVAGVIWFPIAYVFRFYMVVLVEPMLNPLKLPITILAAKIVYPLLGAIRFDATMTGWLDKVMPEALAVTFTLVTLWLLPDAFGFLFWEIKENWRLYRANRPDTLPPATVGHHGETVRALFQPGFHSGTVPWLYGKVRAAERLAHRTRHWQAARHWRHQLHEVEEALRQFVSRELVGLLDQTRCWQGQGLSVGRVELSNNRAVVGLEHAAWPSQPVEVTWELRGRHWLVAGLGQHGWLGSVGSEQAAALACGLVGLYKLADVDLVREQVARALPPGATWDLAGDALVARVAGGGPAVRYGLTADGPLRPVLEGLPVWKDGASDGVAPPDASLQTLMPFSASSGLVRWPELPPEALVFGRWRLGWSAWVAAWQREVPAADGQPDVGVGGATPAATPAAAAS